MIEQFTESVEDTVYFDNGDYYEGQVIGRVPNGFGWMCYADGSEYEGYWMDGQPITSNTFDSKIPGEDDPNQSNVTNIGGHNLRVGFGYTNNTISDIFHINSFIRGIRMYNNTAVLFATGTSVYKDGYGWEKDSDEEMIFKYTGEGLSGDQQNKKGNFFLSNSRSNASRIYLFVKRKPNDYIFNGQVEVKRIETAQEPGEDQKIRKVFKFILRRVRGCLSTPSETKSSRLRLRSK